MIITQAFDDAYLYPGILSALSIANTKTNNLDYIFGFDPARFSRENLALFSSILSERGVKVQALEISINRAWQSIGHISPLTFAKLILADEIKEKHMWIDSDAFMFKEVDFVMSTNDCIGLASHDSMTKNNNKTAIFEHDQKLDYFNAGVIFWPESRQRKNWLSYVEGKGQSNLLYGDQEVINVIYDQLVECLPGTLNANFTVPDATLLIEKPYIAHFPGSQKPWTVPDSKKAKCEELQCGFAQFWKMEKELIASFRDSAYFDVLKSLKAQAFHSQPLKAKVFYFGGPLSLVHKASANFHPHCHSSLIH